MARLVRVTGVEWPGLVISREAQGEAPLLNWLDTLEGLDSPHIAALREAQGDEEGISKIIQYIWASPAIRAKQDWARSKLQKHVKEASLDFLCRVIESPDKYPSVTIAAQKILLLDHCNITSEHDGNMLTSIINKWDKQLLRNMTLSAALREVTKETDKLLEDLERTTHWKNQDYVKSAKEALSTAAAPLPGEGENLEAPKRENFRSETFYKLALARWEASTQNLKT